MPRLAVVACALGACTRAPPAAIPAPNRAAVAAPAHASFTVVPAELADPGVLDRIRHRVRLRHVGEATLVARKRARGPERTAKTDANYVLPVIGESDAQIRIVVEDDHARLALWIDRADAWPTVIGAVQLADSDGRADVAAGVWLEPGATIRLDETLDVRRRIAIVDPALDASGWIASSFLGQVWLADEHAPPPSLSVEEEAVWTPPEDHRVHGRIALGAPIRAAPSPKGAVIATTTAPVFATIGRAYEGFTEIDLYRPQLRVHGYVAARDLSHALEEPLGQGSGRGHGFGISHADHIDVPAGTCLYERVDGEVIGVQIEPSIRLGELHSAGKGWAMVYVENPFSIAVQLYVRDMREVPNDPHWESCTEPLHHR